MLQSFCATPIPVESAERTRSAQAKADDEGLQQKLLPMLMDPRTPDSASRAMLNLLMADSPHEPRTLAMVLAQEVKAMCAFDRYESGRCHAVSSLFAHSMLHARQRAPQQILKLR